MTDSDFSRAIGRLEGRLDAFERTRIERDQAIDRRLAAIDGKLDQLTTAFNMGRGGAIAGAKIGGMVLLAIGAIAWLADRLPNWLR
jgi:hypothetical protein